MRKSKLCCALCGVASDTGRLLSARHGIVCFNCLGDALSAAARSHGHLRGAEQVRHPVTADNRCLLCGDTITTGWLVAYRSPYCLCAQCLSSAMELCLGRDFDQQTIRVVEF